MVNSFIQNAQQRQTFGGNNFGFQPQSFGGGFGGGGQQPFGGQQQPFGGRPRQPMARVSFLHKDCIDLRRNKNKDIMEDDRPSVSVSAIICDIPKFDEALSKERITVVPVRCFELDPEAVWDRHDRLVRLIPFDVPDHIFEKFIEGATIVAQSLNLSYIESADDHLRNKARARKNHKTHRTRAPDTDGDDNSSCGDDSWVGMQPHRSSRKMSSPPVVPHVGVSHDVAIGTRVSDAGQHGKVIGIQEIDGVHKYSVCADSDEQRANVSVVTLEQVSKMVIEDGLEPSSKRRLRVMGSTTNLPTHVPLNSEEFGEKLKNWQTAATHSSQ